MFCILLSFLINRKLNKDLKFGTKKIRIEEVTKKEDKTSYEAGSGTLHIPILGDLFPKLWSKKMKPSYKVFLIINNYRYEIDKQLYDKVKKGDLVEMHYSQCSETLLSIEQAKKKNMRQ
jgi:hypothetical protein